MASDMSLMPLGIVSIETEPPLGSVDFRQTLLMANATVEVSTAVGAVTVWVDATTNRVVANVRGRGAAKLAVNVSVHTLRPQSRFTYQSRCGKATSAADAWSQPAGPNSIGLSHRNADDDIALLNKPGAFNATLQQQGLGRYAESLQSSDHWRRRQFGLVASASGLAVKADNKQALVSHVAEHEFDIVVTTLSEQTETAAEWQQRIGTLHRSHTSDGLSEAWRSHASYWTSFWQQSHIWVTGDEKLDVLTERYAQTRYVQAIQAGTWVPIKFNGMLFTAQLPPESDKRGPSFRQWGSSNWWQNTRLAYGNMLASADFDRMKNIFEFFAQMLDFLSIRTQAAFNHTGIYMTETATLFGAYDPCDYGTDAASRKMSDLNFGYEENKYLKYDFGGDSALPELCTMLLDYYAYTRDGPAMRKYMPLLSRTLDFFSKHYGKIEANKTMRIFPTQGLETYQCPAFPPTPSNCPTNDHPTVAALHVITERALELPSTLVTSEQRDQWQALQSALPRVPLIEENGVTVVSPYETYPSAQHVANCETPELYSTHPFRYFTLARSRLPGERKRDISPSIYCLEKSKRRTCRNADQNTGWTQGVLNAALLGRAKVAARMTLERALIKPAVGYRFPAFAPHFQDYQPSEDHYANMNTALQLMLLSPADDGLDSGGALLFPAWPCEWDVDFKLAAP
eukprot:TRINITY_DN15447_c0_g1_i3.p1 TRINITY_DN15447_c0_g1~~TRINITY_DN15447_c0_g1_i3.p1  ORF type:complete len:786 (+),score=86.08 TRINITY_DN15447_c0_g1_i3:311-2359(+)